MQTLMSRCGNMSSWELGHVWETKLENSRTDARGSILAISCCGGSLFIYPKFSSRSLYQRFMEEITGDDLQIEALPVGSIASDSAVTALLYWQGKLFVGCADRIIKVYSGQ
ncbi:uncharacterized protein LOC117921066 isoform X8 [Vitis riparia]|uniref:uncharacterized protein LOC117921066 isoform X8 n=1 Tax=Vitis riparia TaxID=96939 RepID=UPI00155B0F98|nr:uncharacterized protein LOC117921066 isoform X8 [Vitis riparia]